MSLKTFVEEAGEEQPAKQTCDCHENEEICRILYGIFETDLAFSVCTLFYNPIGQAV